MDWQKIINDKTQLTKIAIALVILVALIIFWTFKSPNQSANSQLNYLTSTADSVSEPVSAVKSESYFVEISGQVKNPGVYQLDREIFTLELIQLAGGFTSQADLAYIHKVLTLASKVTASQKIYIPANNETPSANSLSNNSSTNGLININTASQNELMNLPGVGEVTAQKIVAARPFTNIEGLLEVDGIGDTTYNNLVSLITI